MEMWTSVNGFPLYMVSSMGRIRSLRNGRILKGGLDSDGYRTVLLYPETGKRKNVRWHRLVAEHFIPNPENKPQVNHKDGNKDNNQVDNLEWVTAQENVRHSHDTGLSDFSFNNKPVAKIDVRTGEVLKVYPSIKATVADGYLRNNVGACCRGDYGRITHKGFRWEFYSGTCND